MLSLAWHDTNVPDLTTPTVVASPVDRQNLIRRRTVSGIPAHCACCGFKQILVKRFSHTLIFPMAECASCSGLLALLQTRMSTWLQELVPLCNTNVVFATTGD